jgi:hypothetical protein
MSNAKIKITVDTFLKLQPLQSRELPDDQKFAVKAEDEYPISTFAEADDIHVRVTFDKDASNNQISFPAGNIQRSTWLVFEGHCLVLNADNMPFVPSMKIRDLKLQDFMDQDIKFGFEAIAENKALTIEIQTILVSLGLLSSTPDGKFGPISSDALKRFQELLKSTEKGFLGKDTAKKLIETKRSDIPTPPLPNNLAGRIIKYMLNKNYVVATGDKEFNIVYVEGLNSDGTLNDDTPNEFNDLRLVIEFVNGIPKIVGSWEGTTEPGNYYTFNSMNEKGAARIKFGQYKAWRIGMHGVSAPHRALIQVSPISVYRDKNQDFSRVGDWIDEGLFSVDQHWGFDYPKNDILNASAGCLVGRSTQGHIDFLQIIEQDVRYLATRFGDPTSPGDPSERTYVFYTTIVPGDELLNLSFP